MTILTANKNEMLGNTMKAAAMQVFNKKHQKDIKISLFHGCTIVSVYSNKSWIDYDVWIDGGNFNFLLAQ